MKLGATDLPKLQFSLIVIVLLMAIGAGAVYASLDLIKAARLQRTAVQKERNDFESKLNRVRGEENEIRQKSARFHQLKARGVIGEEQRLEWVELLKDIRDRRRLIELQYEIAPQRSLDATPGGGFKFYASTMKLQVKLLHEEDLTRLLADLRQHARALVQVKSCNVSRLPRGDAENGSHAQLQAECQIDWVTLRAVADK